MAFFEIKQLRKKFGGSVVLDGVDLTLEKGNVLGIIGISGGGKTTLLRCINGLETPDSGRGADRRQAGNSRRQIYRYGLSVVRPVPALDREKELDFGCATDV